MKEFAKGFLEFIMYTKMENNSFNNKVRELSIIEECNEITTESLKELSSRNVGNYKNIQTPIKRNRNVYWCG